MSEPVCKSQESGGYKGEVFIVGLQLSSVKYCFVKSHVRGKRSSNGFSLAKVVKHW